MKWRDHIRIAEQMAQAFGLQDYRQELADGSIEPDQKRTVVHVWHKARKTARAHLYRARRAMLKNRLDVCARHMGIVSHFITDGMIHGTMDHFSHSDDHSTVEGDIGSRYDFSSGLVDTISEGMIDGEFALQEIDGLVQEGLTPETMNRALSILGSTILSQVEAPLEVIQSNQRFLDRVRRWDCRMMGLLGLGGSALGILTQDPLYFLSFPFAFLLVGNGWYFRFLARWGWVLSAGCALGFIYTINIPGAEPNWGRLALTLGSLGIWLYLHFIPDLARWGIVWYQMPPRTRKTKETNI